MHQWTTKGTLLECRNTWAPGNPVWKSLLLDRVLSSMWSVFQFRCSIACWNIDGWRKMAKPFKLGSGFHHLASALVSAIDLYLTYKALTAATCWSHLKWRIPRSWPMHHNNYRRNSQATCHAECGAKPPEGPVNTAFTLFRFSYGGFTASFSLQCGVNIAFTFKHSKLGGENFGLKRWKESKESDVCLF